MFDAERFVMWRWVNHGIVVAAALGMACVMVRYAQAVTYIQGIDVYSGDGTITWSQVAGGGYSFAFVKADEGTQAFDSKFATNMSGANAAGMYVGPYHYAHTESLSPTGSPTFDTFTGGALTYNSTTTINQDGWIDATREADEFVSLIRPYYLQSGTTHYLPPVADIEQAAMPNLSQSLKKTFVSEWTQIFSDVVYNAIGVRPILYVSESSANANFTATVAQEQPFWIAWYKGTGTTNPPVQSNTPNWPAWSFWQWSDGTDSIATSDPVPGAGAHIDRDVFSGTAQQLAAMAVKDLQGDYNFNKTVDAGDYVLWRKENSLSTSDPAKYAAYSTVFLGPDGNLSGTVDSGDFTYWRSQFGKSLSGSGSGLDSSALPEPGANVLLFIWSTLTLIGLRAARSKDACRAPRCAQTARRG